MHSKEEIKKGLSDIFNSTHNIIAQVDKNKFNKRNNGKWSVAQNIEHLILSNNITALSLATPKIGLKQLFGLNSATNQNYDEIVWKYQMHLANGAKASVAFQPKFGFIQARPFLTILWKNSCANVLNALSNWTEHDLDTYVVQHPIIGKITVRELLFFTVYHTKHHQQTISMLQKSNK